MDDPLKESVAQSNINFIIMKQCIRIMVLQNLKERKNGQSNSFKLFQLYKSLSFPFLLLNNFYGKIYYSLKDV